MGEELLILSLALPPDLSRLCVDHYIYLTQFKELQSSLVCIVEGGIPRSHFYLIIHSSVIHRELYIVVTSSSQHKELQSLPVALKGEYRGPI